MFCLAKKYDGKPPKSEIKNAICRNFSGMNEIEPWSIFKKSLELDEVITLFLNHGLVVVQSFFQLEKPSGNQKDIH